MSVTIYAQADVKCAHWGCEKAITCRVELCAPHDSYSGRSDLDGLLEARSPVLPYGWSWYHGEPYCDEHHAEVTGKKR